MSKKTTNSDGHLTQGQFLKSLLAIKDQKRVDQLISEYVDASHDAKTGGAMQKAALKAAELHIAIEKLQEEERKKEKQRDNTDQIKETRPDSGGQKTAFTKSDYYNFGGAAVWYGAAATCLGAGFSTVYSNLMSSQNEAFESQPILATSIALLVPVGGLCIKGLYSLFKTDTGRHRYSILMASSAIASLMSWAGYAAYLFSNTSGAFDADSLSDASSGPIFSGLQTITELLCGAVAGIKGQSILSKYFENRWYENPHYNAVVADLEKLRGRIVSLQEAYAQVTAEIREFEGTRKLAVKDMQARFALLKSQFHFTQNTDGGDNA